MFELLIYLFLMVSHQTADYSSEKVFTWQWKNSLRNWKVYMDSNFFPLKKQLPG